MKKLATTLPALRHRRVRRSASRCLAWTSSTRRRPSSQDAPLLLWVLIGCVVVAELLPINVVLRGQEGELLTSTAFAFATMIAFGARRRRAGALPRQLVGDIARRKPRARAPLQRRPVRASR